jgi:hypothetical protein
MKGVIFNVVEEVIEDLFDADTWDALLDEADVDGAYTALGDYADTELLAIVAAACKATGMSAEEVLRTVGHHALPKLASRVPDSLTDAPDAFSFIRNVNDIIHPEVLKIYPDSIPPAFVFEEHTEGLVVQYRSARNLPALAEGLLSGVSLLFDEDISVTPIEPGENDEPRFLVTSSAHG